MAAGLRFVKERIGDGTGEPILDANNGEEFIHIQPSVSIALGSSPAESPGTLYISSRQVVWLSDTDRGKGYAVDFLSISLHAVSRDLEAYPSPCIYTQIETAVEDDDSEDSDLDSGEVLDVSKITEMRLVPSDPSQLDTLFEIFCECAELNPEPIEEEEGQHNWVFSVDQMVAEGAEDVEPELVSENSSHSIGCSNGTHDLAHDVLQLQINDQRFEDADEMDSENSDHH